MFPRDQLVKTPVRRTFGFDRGSNVTSLSGGSGCDEVVIQRILTVASQRRPHTMGEFGLLTRPYLDAGYQREVAEAHRRYFTSPH